MEVVFSKRAMTALLVETMEKITTETGGVFLGKYESGIWYIVETIDPGPNSIFEPTYFEYDQAYINHLINKVSRLYKNQLDLVGLWHRHPGSLDTFSKTDDGTNTLYANLSGYGAISGLVNIDPKFRLTLYHVILPLNYEKVSYTVDDSIIPESIMELRETTECSRQLEKQQQLSNWKTKRLFDGTLRKTKRTNAVVSIYDYLNKINNSNARLSRSKRCEGELPIELILETLEYDLNYFEVIGVNYSIALNESGFLDLFIKCGKNSISFFFDVNKDGDIVFVFNENIYQYQKGLFAYAVKERKRYTFL